MNETWTYLIWNVNLMTICYHTTIKSMVPLAPKLKVITYHFID